MRQRAMGGPGKLLILAAVFVAGLIVSFAIGYLWPQLQLLSIILSCLSTIAVLIGVRVVVDRRWVLWAASPALALAALGSAMLADDLALTRSGKVTDVVVVDHSTDVRQVHDRTGRHKVYTHTYHLETTDGRPVEKPMIFRGEDGFDGVHRGSKVTVLIDPDGKAPAKPATSVDFGADRGILTVGLVASAGMFVLCIIVLRRREKPPRQPAWAPTA